jgi:ketosteroid isomerase-like protein
MADAGGVDRLRAAVTGRATQMSLPNPINGRAQIVQSALDALASGSFAEATEHFDDHFAFRDNALDLELTDKGRLKEYFERTRELFPDTTVEVLSLFECGERVLVEWRLTATENAAYWRQLRVPIVYSGISSVLVENQKITQWSEYYDGIKARRTGLTTFFVEWMEP